MKREQVLLHASCAICATPIRQGEGKLHLTLRRIHGVHWGECERAFEEAVEAGLAAMVWRREMGR